MRNCFSGAGKLRLNIVLPFALVGFAVCATARGEVLDCDWRADRRVSFENGWVDAEQGRDEDAERVRLAIWGPERIDIQCADLDTDPEPEVLVISRGIGTGPYYRLQIIDFRADGISTWSYASSGVPKIEYEVVSLGRFENGYQGAGTTPEYSNFRLTEDGLIDLGAETFWMMFVTLTVDDKQINLSPVEQRSREGCEFLAQNLLNEFVGTGVTATYSCMSNLDIEESLRPFIN